MPGRDRPGAQSVELILSNVFYEVAALLLVAAAALALKQPLIVAFIAVGILVGPAGLGWVRSHDQIDLLATLGISLLLLVVGLKFDLQRWCNSRLRCKQNDDMNCGARRS